MAQDTSELASRTRRLVATLIDMVLVPTLSVALVLVTGATEDAEDYLSLAGLALSILGLSVVAYLLLNGISLWRHGQTLGKRLLKIALAQPNKMDTGSGNTGSGNTKVPALWRLVCLRALFFPILFFIPFLVLAPPFTAFWIISAIACVDQLFIFTKNRRTLHDLLSGTIVVKVTNQGDS